MLGLMILIGCGEVEGDSIEDCMSQSFCNYLNQDVKTEGSDLANALRDQLVYDEDDIYFTYIINPGGDILFISYHSIHEITHKELDILIPLSSDLIKIVNQFYNIDYVETTILFDEYIEVQINHNEDQSIDFISANLSYDSSKDDEEEVIIHDLEFYFPTVEMLLNYQPIDQIWWYGPPDSIYIEKEDTLRVIRDGDSNTEMINSKIRELLVDYDYILYNPYS